MRGRDAALLRGGEPVARVLDLPWQEDDPDHWERAAAQRARADRARGRARARERRRGDRRRAAVGGRRQLVARGSPGDQGPRQGQALRGGGARMTELDPQPDLRPVRGPLRPRDADSGARRARPRPGRRAARRSGVPRGARRARPHLRGRPSPAHARRAVRARQAALPQARGSEPHRRAQDQQRARPGGARPAARQDADHRRDRRRAARRRDGDGLRALRARVRRLHGLGGHAPAGAQRRADAPARRARSSRSSSARGR